MPSTLRLCSALLSLMVGGLAAADLPLHYWNDGARFPVAISLDEVVVEGQADEARLRAAGRAVAKVDGKRLKISLSDATDANTLRVQIGKLGVGARARAVIRGDGAADERVLTRLLALGLLPGTDAAVFAQRHGLRLVERLDLGVDCWIMEPRDPSLLAALEAANVLQESGAVRFATPLIERQLRLRSDPPTDPVFNQQWHLKNTGTGQVNGGVAGNDINVSPVWDFVGGLHLGTGVNVAVVDDGLERTHEDLTQNARTDLGRNFNGGDPNDPSPGSTNYHGTWCAGLIAARDNTVGGVGAAPRAKLIGVRLIAAPTTEPQDAQALTYQMEDETDASRLVHISSNSWGPRDDVVGDPTLSGAVLGSVRRAALESGTTTGRQNKGIVYVWAAGNGARLEDEDFDGFADYGGDNLSYDGLASSRYVIAVGALGPDGTQASYSEAGPALFVCAGGGDFDPANAGIVTTDRTGSISRPGNYTAASQGISGTSFSTPIVSGIVALLLEANPELTWRDVKHVLARTSTQINGGDGSWQTNGEGFQHSVRYGFGRVDAATAVAAAAAGSWVGVPVATTPASAEENGISVAIPDANPTGVTRTVTVPSKPGFHLEHVEFTVSALHTFRGDLTFRLTSPEGSVSEFTGRELDYGDNLSNWIFTSVVHWGENPTGTWTLNVVDTKAGIVGSLTAWSLRIHGYTPHVAPTVASVSPQRIARGAADTVVTCTGTNFAAGATWVRWNGVNLLTTVMSTTQATAVVPAGSLAAAGTAMVTVATPGFDGEATQVSSGVTVTIDAPPTISSITPSSPSTPEDTPVLVTVVTADSDTASTSLSFTATSANQAVMTNGNLVFSGTGFTRTLTMTSVPDANGTTTVTVAVSDGLSTVTQNVVVTVTAVNDPPVAFGGRFRAQPSVQLQEVVSGYDPDGTSVMFSATDPPSADTQSFTFNTTTGAFTFTSKAGFRGMTSFTYKVFSPESDAARVFITVAGDPNGTRPLIVSEPADEQIAVGGTFSYTVQVDTRRYTIAPTLAFSLVGEPAGMAIDASTGAITWTVAGADRHLSFGIVVKDTITQALDTQTVVLRVVAGGATN